MSLTGATWQEIESRLAKLSQDDLADVLDYLDYLAYKHQRAQTVSKSEQSPFQYRIVVKLGGILKKHPISDKEIAAARQEIWSGFGEQAL